MVTKDMVFGNMPSMEEEPVVNTTLKKLKIRLQNSQEEISDVKWH